MNDLEETYGPAAKYSDYRRGDTITYRLDDQEHTGEIIYICAPGRTISGAAHSQLYVVVRSDAVEAFPDFVSGSEIVAAASN